MSGHQTTTNSAKLRRMILIATAMVLLPASSAYVVINVPSYRQAMVEHFQTVADLTGAHSPASLTFDDQKTVNELLRSTRTEKPIVEAGIYRNTGERFAAFVANPDAKRVATENLVQVSEQNREVFSRLDESGVSLAIDDFGTGFSSLSSSVHVPIDAPKIDRRFISAMLDNPDAATIVGTIVGLAHAMEYSVVAEGVERFDQAHAPAGIGCDIAQGLLFSRPVGPAAISMPARNDDRVRTAQRQAQSPDVVEQTA